MRLPRIGINSQLGMIGIKSRNAELKGLPPDMDLSMRGNAGASVRLKTTLPHVEIDQRRSQESAMIYTPLRYIKTLADRGNQKAMGFIGRIASEGLELMSVERGGGGEDAIQRIAKRKAVRDPVQLTIKMVTPPEIRAQMGSVAVQDGSEKVRTNWIKGQSTLRYTEGAISFSWNVEPSMEIFVIPGSESPYPGIRLIGRHVDAAV